MLACRWIEHARTQPPTEFSRLTAGPWVSDEERAWIAELEGRKAAQREGDNSTLPPFLRPWMQAQLNYFTGIGPTLARKMEADPAALDEVLRTFVAPGIQGKPLRAS